VSDGIELTDDEYDTFMAVLAEQRCQHSHADTACPPPPERAILTDLIAELVGDDGDGHELTGDDKHGCQVCAAIDRAEARLQQITEGDG
jgi:hypothetical protein